MTVLSPEQVVMSLLQAQQELGVKLTMDELVGLAAIPSRESGYETTAHNPNRATGDDSYGLWQVNMLGGMGVNRRNALGITNNEALYDPVTSAKAAIQLVMDGRSRGNPLYAWGGYKGLSNTYNVSPHATDTAQMAVQSVLSGARSGGLQTMRQSIYGQMGASGDTSQRLVSWLKAQIGKPYKFGSTGGADLSAFDCSGLISRAYQDVLGVDLPAYTFTMKEYGQGIPANGQLQPGDMIFTHGSQGDFGHVGVYVGDGTVIDAPHTGATVRETPLSGWLSRAQSIRRVVDGNGSVIVGDGLVAKAKPGVNTVSASAAQYAAGPLPLAGQFSSLQPGPPPAPTPEPSTPTTILPERQPMVLPGLGRMAPV